jgi:preprotein translocase subunit YajC
LPFLTAAEGLDISMIASYILPFAVVIVVFYFMLIRPESKRKKSVQKMLSELSVGNEVTTRGGIVGKISAIKDDVITIESGKDRTQLQVMRWAVSSTGKGEAPAQQ